MFFTIFFLIKRPSKIYLQPKFIIIQLILTGLFLASCLFSTNPGFSIPQFFIWLNCWLLIDIFLLSQIPTSVFTNSAVILATIYSVILLALKIHPLNIDFFTNDDGFLNPLLPNTPLCDYLVFAIPIVYYSINKINKQQVRLFILFFLSIILFITNSRTAVVSVIVGLEILNHFNPKPYFPRLRLYFITFLIFYFGFFLFGSKYTINKSPTGHRQYYWYQAIKGFQENPIFGLGPANFLYASIKYQPVNISANAMSAHNIFLDYLSQNGLIFSTIFFILIIFYLRDQFLQNPLFFTVGFVSLFNSIFSASWASPGIFIISLIFIFSNHQAFTTKKNHLVLLVPLIATIIFIHLTRLIIFNQLISQKNYNQAASVYPYNLILHLNLIQRNQDVSKFSPYFSNDFRIYYAIISAVPLPQSEKYYYQLLSISPQASFIDYISLIRYYLNTNNPDVEKLFSHFLQYPPTQGRHQFSYFLNQYANSKKSNFYYEKSIEMSPNWGPLYIDYANFLWYNHQEERAVSILNNCQKINSPKLECQSYFQSNQFDIYPPGTYPIPSPEIYDKIPTPSP